MTILITIQNILKEEKYMHTELDKFLLNSETRPKNYKLTFKLHYFTF